MICKTCEHNSGKRCAKLHFNFAHEIQTCSNYVRNKEIKVIRPEGNKKNIIADIKNNISKQNNYEILNFNNILYDYSLTREASAIKDYDRIGIKDEKRLKQYQNYFKKMFVI